MKNAALATLLLGLGSCSFPAQFQQGGSQRGFVKQFTTYPNKWVDIRVNNGTQVQDVARVSFPGYPNSMRTGWYAIDFDLAVGLRRRDWKAREYGGMVTDPFKVQVFILPRTHPTETDPDPVGFEGEDADLTAYPLYKELPPFMHDFELILTKDAPTEEPDPPVPNPSPQPVMPVESGGELFVVNPPLRVGEPWKRSYRRYFFAPGLSGTEMALVVRADALNDIHPEHDGYEHTAVPNYLYPDFVQAPPPPRSNNEGFAYFHLP